MLPMALCILNNPWGFIILEPHLHRIPILCFNTSLVLFQLKAVVSDILQGFETRAYDPWTCVTTSRDNTMKMQ